MSPQRQKKGATAPGIYLGFGLQPVRLCYYLLHVSPEDYVSIEHAEDIAIHRPSGDTVLEQTKSALSHNPVANWADDLWKTFANWVTGIESGVVRPETTQFRIYVCPRRSGNFVQLLSDAHTDAAADAAVALITRSLNAKAQKSNPVVAPYIQKLLALDLSPRRLLIKNFTFESADDDPVQVLRVPVGITVSPQMVDACCHYAIGKAKEEADQLIRARRPALIHAGQFQTQFRAFVHKHDLSGMLATIAAPGLEEVTRLISESPTFVRQLDLIDVPIEQRLRAASDYLRATASKTQWAELGQIVGESLEELDNDLVRRHELIGGELKDIQRSLTPKVRGRTLFFRCLQFTTTLEGRELPGHFVPGCYNDLADRLKLGWHPEYVRLLKRDGR